MNKHLAEVLIGLAYIAVGGACCGISFHNDFKDPEKKRNEFFFLTFLWPLFLSWIFGSVIGVIIGKAITNRKKKGENNDRNGGIGGAEKHS